MLIIIAGASFFGVEKITHLSFQPAMDQIFLCFCGGKEIEFLIGGISFF